MSELRDGEDRSRYAHTFRLPTSTEEIRGAVAEAFVAPISPLPPLAFDKIFIFSMWPLG